MALPPVDKWPESHNGLAPVGVEAPYTLPDTAP